LIVKKKGRTQNSKLKTQNSELRTLNKTSSQMNADGADEHRRGKRIGELANDPESFTCCELSIGRQRSAVENYEP
jgi:hypothetical protein